MDEIYKMYKIYMKYFPIWGAEVACSVNLNKYKNIIRLRLLSLLFVRLVNKRICGSVQCSICTINTRFVTAGNEVQNSMYRRLKWQQTHLLIYVTSPLFAFELCFCCDTCDILHRNTALCISSGLYLYIS